MSAPDIGSADSGASYYSRNGTVYARVNGVEQEAATALSANGRELGRHHAALQAARRQREAQDRSRQ